jgi:hypothetical protein
MLIWNTLPKMSSLFDLIYLKHMVMKIINLVLTSFLSLCIVSTDRMLATDLQSDSACPPLSQALISPKHRIYKELDRDYYKLSRYSKKLRSSSSRRYLSTGSIQPDLNGKITSLIKVGDYGVAKWTKEQYIAVFFKKNQLVLLGSQMIGYYELPCINCQDNDAAVDSLEKVLPGDANVQCIYKLYFENQRRFSK